MHNDIDRSVLARRILPTSMIGLLLLGACAPDTTGRGAPGEPEADPGPQLGAVELPELDSTLRVLAEAAPRRGPATFEALAVQPGELWININCKGSGDLVVRFAPLDEFVFHCTDELLVTKNQLNLVNARSVQVSVGAPADVEWALRVQQ